MEQKASPRVERVLKWIFYSLFGIPIFLILLILGIIFFLEFFSEQKSIVHMVSVIQKVGLVAHLWLLLLGVIFIGTSFLLVLMRNKKFSSLKFYNKIIKKIFITSFVFCLLGVVSWVIIGVITWNPMPDTSVPIVIPK